MIDNLNRVARLAFQDSPEIARQFNRNLIERGRRSLRKVEGGQVVEVSEEEAVSPGDASGSLGEVVTDLAV
jgi:hypothetical protein